MDLQAKSIVRITDLTKHFGKVKALDGFTMSINRGDICGFLGPNGSGKSTTIRILLSLIKPDSGGVKVFGEDIRHSRKHSLSKIGALIERPQFYEHLKARKNLELLMRYAGTKIDKKKIATIMDIVGLKGREEDKVGNYSEGMKQRLGIAQALLNDPELLILDEPFNNLDPQGVRDIRELIIRLNTENQMTVLISSHQLDEIEKLATKVVLIDRGKSLGEGDLKEMLAKNTAGITLEVDKPEKTLKILEGYPELVDTLIRKSNIISFRCNRLRIHEVNAILVREGIKVYKLNPDESLESVFLTMVDKV